MNFNPKPLFIDVSRYKIAGVPGGLQQMQVVKNNNNEQQILTLQHLQLNTEPLQHKLFFFLQNLYYLQELSKEYVSEPKLFF